MTTKAPNLGEKLTKSVCQSIEYQGREYVTTKGGLPRWQRCVVWDRELKGFGLRVYPSGKKTFILSYRVRGRKRLMTLGPFGPLTAEMARDLATEYLGGVHQKTPIDPLEEKQRATERERQAWKVSKLVKVFLDEHVSDKKPSTQREYKRILDKEILPRWGRRKAKDLTSADVLLLKNSLKAKPYMANRVLAVASKLFNFAEKYDVRPLNSNPCQHVEKFKEKARKDRLTVKELQRLGDALAALEAHGPERKDRGGKVMERSKLHERQDREAAAAIRLLLYTGCRLNEVMKLRWENVDLERGVISLPDAKSGARDVVLSAPAIEVLAGLSNGRRTYVFRGRKAGTPRNDGLMRPWDWIKSRAGLDIRLHSLRHTVGSMGGDANLSLLMIAELLGHKQTKTSERYIKVDADPVRKATDKVAGEISAALNGKEAASVVDINTRENQ